MERCNDAMHRTEMMQCNDVMPCPQCVMQSSEILQGEAAALHCINNCIAAVHQFTALHRCTASLHCTAKQLRSSSGHTSSSAARINRVNRSSIRATRAAAAAPRGLLAAGRCCVSAASPQPDPSVRPDYNINGPTYHLYDRASGGPSASSAAAFMPEATLSRRTTTRSAPRPGASSLSFMTQCCTA
jgi:hypothetical protein